MANAALIDGVETSAGWLNERAFQFGDGLFETVAVINAQPCLWDAHMARLETGCQRLRLAMPNGNLLRQECRTLCSGHERAVVKIYWTGGTSDRGYRRRAAHPPRRILQRFDWVASDNDRAWTLRFCDHRLSDNPILAGIKHLNRLDQVIARAEWEDHRYDEGLMRDQRGSIVCGTMSNVVAQFGDQLATPRVDLTGVAGVVRATLLDFARNGPTKAHERALSADEIMNADALFMTNSLIGVRRVGRLESTEYDVDIPVHPLISDVAAVCHHPSAAF